MNTPARIAHRTDGRIRIEVPSRRGDAAFFADLAAQLAQSGQVSRARGNAAAASVAIEYGGPLDTLLAQCERCQLDLARPAGANDAQGASVGQRPAFMPTSWPVNWPANLGTNLSANLGANPLLVAGAAFGLVGLVQTARGDIMVPAMSAFWYAVSALRLARLPSSGERADQAAHAV